MSIRLVALLALMWAAPTAYAQLNEQVLFVAKEGQGLITTRPSGLFCGIGCTAASAGFDFGDLVEVRAQPALGWEFDSWSGSCSGNQDCEVIMISSRTVGVTFTRINSDPDPDPPTDPPDPSPPQDNPEPSDQGGAPARITPIINLILNPD